MRNIEKLRNYFLGKDPQLKETMADNSLRLIGIEGKHFVLRVEMLRKLEALKKELTDEDEELQGLIDNLETALGDLELKHDRDIAAVEEDIGAEESARILADNALSGRIDTNAGDIAALTFWKNTTDFVLASDLATALLNYYTKDEVDQLISVIPTFDIQVVQTLPVEGDGRVLYLAPSQDPETSNVYDEFIWVIPTGQLIGQWEKIGSTAVDMSNYYTKSETDTLLNTKQGTLTAGSNVQINGNTISATDTTYDDFEGATGSSAGASGLVPAPAAADNEKYLKGDGTWDTPQGGGGGSYTAGDYIDITNNEISVTGIVPGMTVEEIPLTSGYSYGYVSLSEPLPSPTVDANGKIGVIENTTNAAQTIYIRCSGEPNYDDNSYAFKTHYGSEEYPTDEVATVRYSEPGQNTTERYFGTVLEPGEKLYFSFHQTNVTPASVYKYTFENSESLTMIPDHSAVYDGQNEVVDVVASQGDAYAVFVNNTGNTGMFYFKGQGYSGSYPLIHTDSNNNVIWVFKMSSDYLDFYGDEFYFWGVEMNPGDKFYITYDNDHIATAARVYGTPGVLSDYTKFTDTFVGTDGTSNGKAGVVPAPTANDANKYLKSDGTWGTVSAGSSDYDDLTDKPQINSVTLSGNKTSADLGLDMVILSYGNSTWQEFLDAYRRNAVVYCRASSNSNPATGSQTRLAFMAYVNNATNPTEVEFQYYRSVSAKTASQQGDQVFVYKLASAGGGTWTVATRENGSKVVAGTNMTSTYSNGVLTLNATGGSGEMNTIDSISVNGVAQTPDANKNVDLTVPTITYGTTDLTPGTSTLADGEFYFVYE